MSTVIVWGTDEGTGSIGSCYVASDSRFSTGSKSWDYGQKVYALKKGGIIAYVGDVLFPMTLITQLIDIIDRNILFDETDDNDIKANLIYEHIVDASSKYLASLRGTNIIIVLVKNKIFNVYEIGFNAVQINKINIVPGEPLIYGSGSADYKKSLNKLKPNAKQNLYGSNIDESKLSRYIFQSLVDSVHNGKDKMSGGNIQLVALYKNMISKPIGIIEKKKLYLYGQEIEKYHDLFSIEWRNEKFEICNPEVKDIEIDAQKQPFHEKLQLK